MIKYALILLIILIQSCNNTPPKNLSDTTKTTENVPGDSVNSKPSEKIEKKPKLKYSESEWLIEKEKEWQSKERKNKFTIKALSKKFNIIIKVESVKKDWCSGSAEIIVTNKKGKKIQSIKSDDCRFGLDRNKLPFTDPFKEAAIIYLNDFNFDRYDDLAVVTEMGGGYGGATFSIYLYNPKKNKFIYSKELTWEAGFDNCNYIFTVDKKHQKLITYQRGGIDYLDTREYIVVNNKPKQILYKSESTEDGYKITKTEKLKNDNLIKATTRRKLKEGEY